MRSATHRLVHSTGSRHPSEGRRPRLAWRSSHACRTWSGIHGFPLAQEWR